MQERKILLAQKYSQGEQPMQVDQTTNAPEACTPIGLENLIANLKAGSSLKPYVFARERGFDTVIWNGQGGQAVMSEYNQTFPSIDNDVFWDTHGRSVEERVKNIWQRSHSQEAAAEANQRNRQQGGMIIQEGDLLHGTTTQYLADILREGLWCDEAKYGQHRSSLGANYLSVAFGKATSTIDKIRHLLESDGKQTINVLALKTFYPFLRLGNQQIEVADSNDYFFVQYHGNMASCYGPMEPELARLHAIPQRWIYRYDDRKGNDDLTANTTLIFRPQQEGYKGTGYMMGGTSREVDVPFGVAATDLKGIIVNGRNETETREVLRIVAQSPFYVPVYDCVTGDVLNPQKKN